MNKIVLGSFVTMHYRLSIVSADGQEEEIINTYDWSPATFTIGDDQLTPGLSNCLIGLPESSSLNERKKFFLKPENAFGKSNQQLIEWIKLSALPADLAVVENSLIQFTSPAGVEVSGFVRQLLEDKVLIDFNHPLAGKELIFEVSILSIL